MKSRKTLPAVYLEKPSRAREEEFLKLARAGRAFLKPWVSPPFTRAQFAKYLEREKRPDYYRCFFICDGEDGRLLGVINISQIVMGFLRSAYLGYYVFAPDARRGVMTAGLSLALDQAFGKIGLHRVEANVQPGNIASRKLANRLGFTREGFSRRYLQVLGKWRDHERWALLKEDWRGARSRTR